MTWQPYESRGIVIDMLLADKLSSYFESKEVEICTKIMEALSHSVIFPSLIPALETQLHLHEAVDELGNKIERLSQSRHQTIPKDEWKIVSTQIQKSLSKYIEILEANTKELFHQLEHIGFEQWDTQLSFAMSSINETLKHRIEDLMWANKQLEQQFQRFKAICNMQHGQRRIWHGFGFSRRRIFDRSMEFTLIKTLKFLKTHYQKFTKKYANYMHLNEEAAGSLQKFHNLRRLATLELDNQNHIKRVYELLKMWEYNLSAKALPTNEIMDALKNSYSPEKVMPLLNEYYSAIQKGLYDKSRMIKKKFREVFQDIQARQPIIHNLSGYCHELHILEWICAKYRECLLIKKHSSKGKLNLEFSRWGVKSESEYDKQLQGLISNTIHLRTLCEKFYMALESDQVMLKTLTPEVDEIIMNSLNEMGQPLSSKATISEDAIVILNHLKNLDELISFHPEVVNYTCKILCKLMRADWKYQVLQGIPLFHEIYNIHHGIVGPLEERQNADRLNNFKSILNQLNQWTKQNQALEHAHEINFGINDIKAYLQDFFASIQGLKNLKEMGNTEVVVSKSLEKTYEALLEYRYTFSEFFHHLRPDVPEERMIRKQFLFVDQYFEAIENRLQMIE